MSAAKMVVACFDERRRHCFHGLHLIYSNSDEGVGGVRVEAEERVEDGDGGTEGQSSNSLIIPS